MQLVKSFSIRLDHNCQVNTQKIDLVHWILFSCHEPFLKQRLCDSSFKLSSRFSVSSSFSVSTSFCWMLNDKIKMFCRKVHFTHTSSNFVIETWILIDLLEIIFYSNYGKRVRSGIFEAWTENVWNCFDLSLSETWTEWSGQTRPESGAVVPATLYESLSSKKFKCRIGWVP